MKKTFFVLLLFITSCGYQPLYTINSSKSYEFKKIIFNGDNYVNRKIANILSIEENDKSGNQNTLSLSSSYKIEEISKNSKGQVELYKSTLNVDLVIKNINNETIKSRNFVKEFSYNNKQNKFDLSEYQNNLKDDLLDKIINDIIIFLNL